MLEKALEESAIPFFQVESNTINLWRNCQKFSLEQLLAATRAMHRRGREWETTTQTCVLCLTIFLSHPQKMARRKASIDPGMTGKRKITDFLIRAPAPAPTPTPQPAPQESEDWSRA